MKIVISIICLLFPLYTFAYDDWQLVWSDGFLVIEARREQNSQNPRYAPIAETGVKIESMLLHRRSSHVTGKVEPSYYSRLFFEFEI